MNIWLGRQAPTKLILNFRTAPWKLFQSHHSHIYFPFLFLPPQSSSSASQENIPVFLFSFHLKTGRWWKQIFGIYNQAEVKSHDGKLDLYNASEWQYCRFFCQQPFKTWNGLDSGFNSCIFNHICTGVVWKYHSDCGDF